MYLSTGDVIYGYVYQDTSGFWVYDIEDLTSGLSSLSEEPYSGVGMTAEWIAEDTGDPTTQGLYPLADFGSVTFTDLTLAPTSGSWYLPSFSDAIEMVATDGSLREIAWSDTRLGHIGQLHRYL